MNQLFARLANILGIFGHQVRHVKNVPFGRYGAAPRAQVLGHQMEIQMGKHRFQKKPPPRVPKHPTKETNNLNMNQYVRYADLKLRWKPGFKPSKKNMSIKRKWKVIPARGPRPAPTCLFMLHSHLPLKTVPPSKPPLGLIKDQKDLFAVVKTSYRLQHKVTQGDIIQTERMHRKQAGDQVTLGTVLLVGSRDFSIIGKPVVPYAQVHCTVEQQTLSKETISFSYKPRRRMSRFKRVRQWVTMLRVNRIELDPTMEQNQKVLKPAKLLDLWANRWLTAKEIKNMGETPKFSEISGSILPEVDLTTRRLLEDVEGADQDQRKETSETVTPRLKIKLWNDVEHQPGTNQRRGLVDSYRYVPDPQAHNKGWF